MAIPDDGQNRAGKAGPAEAECRGRVVAVRDGRVVVEVDTPADCESCHSRGTCHVAALGSKQVEVDATGFAVGDRVRIIAFSAAVVRASLVLYLIPALLVVVGSFAGYATAEAFFGVEGNTGSLVGVIVGIMLSLLFVHFYRISRADGGVTLRLERIE
jgi:positive regulator of sigma E activity